MNKPKLGIGAISNHGFVRFFFCRYGKWIYELGEDRHNMKFKREEELEIVEQPLLSIPEPAFALGQQLNNGEFITGILWHSDAYTFSYCRSMSIDASGYCIDIVWHPEEWFSSICVIYADTIFNMQQKNYKER